MTKEFIPYEQALALKELGFDESCLALYYHLVNRTELNELILYKDYFENVKETLCTNSSLGSTYLIAVPLYQQAFKWFRARYKFYHEILVYGDWENLNYSYIIVGRTGFSPDHMYSFEKVKSYEEGELACLDKLIALAKGLIKIKL